MVSSGAFARCLCRNPKDLPKGKRDCSPGLHAGKCLLGRTGWLRGHSDALPMLSKETSGRMTKALGYRGKGKPFLQSVSPVQLFFGPFPSNLKFCILRLSVTKEFCA